MTREENEKAVKKVLLEIKIKKILVILIPILVFICFLNFHIGITEIVVFAIFTSPVWIFVLLILQLTGKIRI